MLMLKTDTCRKYKIDVTSDKHVCYAGVHKCLVSTSIDLCMKYKNNLKPVSCRHRLLTHSARPRHI